MIRAAMCQAGSNQNKSSGLRSSSGSRSSQVGRVRPIRAAVSKWDVYKGATIWRRTPAACQLIGASIAWNLLQHPDLAIGRVPHLGWGLAVRVRRKQELGWCHGGAMCRAFIGGGGAMCRAFIGGGGAMVVSLVVHGHVHGHVLVWQRPARTQ